MVGGWPGRMALTQSLFHDFAKQVLMRLAEVKSSSAPGDVIQVQ